MFDFQKSVEEKIQEAIKNGVFDNLPGKGKPLDLRDYFRAPVEKRLTLHLLKNAGFLPPEIEIKKEIDRLKEKHTRCASDEEKESLKKEINWKTTQLNYYSEQSRLGK